MKNMYYLKNKINNEIVDVLASSLDSAKAIASKYLGGRPIDYVERF